METLDLLKAVPLFRELAEEELKEIAAFLEEKSYGEDETVIREDTVDSSIFIIKNGLAKVMKQLDEHQAETLAVLKEGDCFGEMSMFDHRPRSADVKVKAGSTLYILPGKRFEKYLEEHPHTALKVYRAAVLMLCQRLRDANQILVYSRILLYQE